MLEEIKIIRCTNIEHFKEVLDDCIAQLKELRDRLEVSNGDEF